MNDSYIIWSPGTTLEAIERECILRSYAFYKDKTAASNALGISVRNLYDKLAKYEAEGAAAKKRIEEERAQRTAELARHRGIHPNQYDATDGPKPTPVPLPPTSPEAAMAALPQPIKQPLADFPVIAPAPIRKAKA